MERSFIVTKESEYYQDIIKFFQRKKEQSDFVSKFLKEKGIESKKYVLSGDGWVNTPFSKNHKNDIGFEIIPTDNDSKNFGKMLCKPKDYGLCAFKKTSIILKEIQEKCVQEKIIINLYEPRTGDYFSDLSMGGYNINRFKYDDKLYIKLNSSFLTDKSKIPEGFIEIKISEFYNTKEKLEESN